MSVLETWHGIKEWAKQNRPVILKGLQGPATDQDIKRLQTKLGIEIPEDLRASLRLHNGEKYCGGPRVFPPFGEYLSTDGIGEEWSRRLKVSEELGSNEEADKGFARVIGHVRPIGFSKKWIPFMEFNGDVFWAIDLSPDENGAEGQIIEVDWEGVSWKVIAPSLSMFLKKYLSDLKSGKYEIDDEGFLVEGGT